MLSTSLPGFLFTVTQNELYGTCQLFWVVFRQSSLSHFAGPETSPKARRPIKQLFHILLFQSPWPDHCSSSSKQGRKALTSDTQASRRGVPLRIPDPYRGKIISASVPHLATVSRIDLFPFLSIILNILLQSRYNLCISANLRPKWLTIC